MKGKYKKIKIKENHKKVKLKHEKFFDYGLALLKSYMAFLVLISHCFNKKTTKNELLIKFTTNRQLHVPSFFIMSFYFMHKNLLLLNPKIIFNRLLRLLIPYIIWPFIAMKINHYYNIKYHKNFHESYEDLIYQLKWGRRLLPQFWFQWNLIFHTIFFILIIFLFRKYSLFIMYILLLLSYKAQYSGYHTNYYIMKYPDVISLLFESLPYAVTGFALGYYKIIEILHNHKIKTFILSAIIYKIIADYYIFRRIKGLNFQGINLNIQSICVIFIFSLFPSDKIKNIYIQKFLIIITNYSAGVFYLHISIKDYFSYYFDDIKNGTFKGMFINYFICYFICFFGMKIFGKTPLKYLFS